MFAEIPQYGLRAYALFYSKYGSEKEFGQSELDWIVNQSMKKKIFSLLLRFGWIRKRSRTTYECIPPQKIIKGLLEFKVPTIIKKAKKKYAFTKLSAIEIWSDFSYVQRGKEKSPYFIKILKKDLEYWKEFFNSHNTPNYIEKGSTVGEFIIFIPVGRIEVVEKDGLLVEKLKKAMQLAKDNEIYSYAYNYMRKKYGNVTT